MSQTSQAGYSDQRNTPSESLRHFTEMEILHSGGSQRHFSMLLASNYHEMIPERSRSINGLTNWQELRDSERERAILSNKKLLNRYLKSNNIPVELLPVWIETLSEYRLPCVVEIFKMSSLIPCVDTQCNQYESMSQIMAEFSSVISAMSPIMRDSVIDEMDKPHAPAAIQEIDNMISVLGSLRNCLLRLDENGLPLPVMDVQESKEALTD